ncbi:hypothetical protein BDV10DRAFT_105375 [Aspergillus recurvatus]
MRSSSLPVLFRFAPAGLFLLAQSTPNLPFVVFCCVACRSLLTFHSLAHCCYSVSPWQRKTALHVWRFASVYVYSFRPSTFSLYLAV